MEFFHPYYHLDYASSESEPVSQPDTESEFFHPYYHHPCSSSEDYRKDSTDPELIAAPPTPRRGWTATERKSRD